MINEHELMVWTAGLVEGCGRIQVVPAIGPTGEEYASIALYVDVLRETELKRLMRAANNGTIESYGWVLSGIASIRGFMESIWTWLTPEARSHVNARFREFKELKQKLAS